MADKIDPKVLKSALIPIAVLLSLWLPGSTRDREPAPRDAAQVPASSASGS